MNLKNAGLGSMVRLLSMCAKMVPPSRQWPSPGSPGQSRSRRPGPKVPLAIDVHGPPKCPKTCAYPKIKAVWAVLLGTLEVQVGWLFGIWGAFTEFLFSCFARGGCQICEGL